MKIYCFRKGLRSSNLVLIPFIQSYHHIDIPQHRKSSEFVANSTKTVKNAVID